MGNKSYAIYDRDLRPRNEYYPCDSNQPFLQAETGGVYKKFEYTRTGTAVPNFRTKIAKGESATSNMTVDLSYVGFIPPGLFVQYANSLCPTNRGCAPVNQHAGMAGVPELMALWPPDPAPTDLEISADTIAAIAIRKKIKALTQSYEGLTFLGELRESLKMIRSPAQTLRQKVSLFIDEARNHRRKPSFSKVLADLWLEHSFGWNPLIGDITAAASAAVDITSPSIRRVVGVGKAERAKEDPAYSTGVLGLPIVTSYNNTMRWEVGVLYRAGVRTTCNASQGSLQRIVDHGGFDLSQVVPTAWELVPWSFLIDYFVSIGDTLSAWFTSTSNVAWSQRTVRTERTRDLHSGVISSIDGMVTTRRYQSGRFIYKRTRYVRTSSTIPIPGLVFKMPPLDSAKWLNIGALALASRESRNSASRR